MKALANPNNLVRRHCIMFVTQIVCACADVVKHEDPHIDCVVFFPPFLFSQSAFVNRPALGILPPENFPEKLTESLLSVRTYLKHSLSSNVYSKGTATLETFKFVCV